MKPCKQRSPFVGSSRWFEELSLKISRLKGHEVNVLLEGESGTGKGVIASLIHRQENNPQRPFVAINCAAVPDHLIEAELFGCWDEGVGGMGHKKIGRLELADGGDLFIDEIGFLKKELQTKLLQVMREKKFYQLGGTRPIKSRFRILATTTLRLEALVQEGRFSADFLRGLRILYFHIPPLRDRKEDIPTLIHLFAQKYATGQTPKTCERAALDRMISHDWPGNVRELKNLIYSLNITVLDREIRERDLPSWLGHIDHRVAEIIGEQIPGSLSQVVPLKIFMRGAERFYLQNVMRLSEADKTRLAKLLGISRASLYDKIKNLN